MMAYGMANVRRWDGASKAGRCHRIAADESIVVTDGTWHGRDVMAYASGLGWSGGCGRGERVGGAHGWAGEARWY